MAPFSARAAAWFRSPDKLALLKLRARKLLRVEKPLPVSGSRLVFAADSGLELNRARRIAEPWTAEWMQRLPEGAVLWDVGANVGIFALLAAENPKVRHVVAIEPSAQNFARLVRNAIRNGLSARLTPLAVGLGDRTARRDFSLQNLDEGGALHGFGALHAFRGRSTVPAATYGALCFRLDDLVRLDGLPFPTHLKIDIDGGEAEVIAGADETLSDPRLAGIQVEVMDDDPALPRRHTLAAAIESHGWRLAETIEHPSPAPRIADLRFIRAD